MTSIALNYFTASLLTAITTFVLAVFVLSIDPRSKLYRTFFLYTISISLWSFPFAFIAIVKDKNTALILGHAFNIGVTFISTGFVHFVCILLNIKNRGRLIRACYVISFFFLLLVPTKYMVLGVVPKFGLNYFINPGIAYYPFVLFWGTCIVYGLYKLFRGYLVSTGMRRNQLKYLFFGSLLGYIGGPANFLLFLVLNFQCFPLEVMPVLLS